MLDIWSYLTGTFPEPTRKLLLWKELVALLGNGRVFSVASEASHLVAEASETVRDPSWLSDGSKYCSWMGENLLFMLGGLTFHKGGNADDLKAWVQMLERALTLGHVGEVFSIRHCKHN